MRGGYVRQTAYADHQPRDGKRPDHNANGYLPVI
jgi:hypothetical protein